MSNCIGLWLQSITICSCFRVEACHLITNPWAKMKTITWETSLNRSLPKTKDDRPMVIYDIISMTSVVWPGQNFGCESRNTETQAWLATNKTNGLNGCHQESNIPLQLQVSGCLHQVTLEGMITSCSDWVQRTLWQFRLRSCAKEDHPQVSSRLVNNIVLAFIELSWMLCVHKITHESGKGGGH